MSFDPVPAEEADSGRGAAPSQAASCAHDARVKSAWHLDHDRLVEISVLRTLPARVHAFREGKELADRSWARKPGMREQRSAMSTRRAAHALPSARADVRARVG